MSHTAYVGILIVVFMCFMALVIITGAAFGEYCSRVAATEGRLEELLKEDMSGGEDWGPYRVELFRRLYKKPAAPEDQSLLQLKKWLRRGFNMTFALLLSFVAILYFFI